MPTSSLEMPHTRCSFCGNIICTRPLLSVVPLNVNVHVPTCLLRHQIQCVDKLKGVAPLLTDPPRWSSTDRQNPPICNPPLYIAIPFEPIIQFCNFLGNPNKMWNNVKNPITSANILGALALFKTIRRLWLYDLIN